MPRRTAAALLRFAAYCPSCLRVYACTPGPWQHVSPIGSDEWERLEEAVRWHLADRRQCRVMYADRTEVIFRRATEQLTDVRRNAL